MQSTTFLDYWFLEWDQQSNITTPWYATISKVRNACSVVPNNSISYFFFLSISLERSLERTCDRPPAKIDVILVATPESVKKESSSGCFLSAMERKDVVSGGQASNPGTDSSQVRWLKTISPWSEVRAVMTSTEGFHPPRNVDSVHFKFKDMYQSLLTHSYPLRQRCQWWVNASARNEWDDEGRNGGLWWIKSLSPSPHLQSYSSTGYCQDDNDVGSRSSRPVGDPSVRNPYRLIFLLRIMSWSWKQPVYPWFSAFEHIRPSLG